jgi:class 3 adenylate cyclase
MNLPNTMNLTDNLRPARIGHILFLDIVGFSKLPLADQQRQLDRLNTVTAASETFQKQKAQDALLVLPTGDGMALVFQNDLTAPARCAIDIAYGLRSGTPPVPVRIGIHSGLVQPHLDLMGRENLVGEGINTAHRVMECAGEGHILVSGEHAHWLQALEEWAPRLTDLGTAVVKHGLRLELFALTDGQTKATVILPVSTTTAIPSEPAETATDVVLLYRRNSHPDIEILEVIESELTARGLTVFFDRSTRPGVEAQRQQEERLRTARAVIPIISPSALRSEMLQYALEAALDSRQHQGKPAILPVQIGPSEQGTEDDLSIRELIAPFPYFSWSDPSDTPRLVAELLSALREPIKPRDLALESVGGGMNPTSPFYIERSADSEFRRLLERHHSIVLIRGGRQIGKTSLLARGMQLARDQSWRSVRTDFQKLSGASLAGAPVFYRQLAISLARQCQFTYDFGTLWDEASDPGQNFEYFLRDLLEAEESPLIWFMDEADKVFSATFSTDFFGLVRSWHNDRAAEPDGPLSRLTIVIAYATEAHLFISDLNQSPFNVGERVPLEDFTIEQVLRLNDLYDGPLGSRADLETLHTLLGGQPYLTRRALDVLAREKTGFDTLIQDAIRDDGPFSDHLKRVYASVSAQEEVTRYVQTLLAGEIAGGAAPEAYYRLLRAGIVRQDRDGNIVFRCLLYLRYLREHLTGND